MKILLVYITASNRQEAFFLARQLVEAKLVACANILDGATSIYEWEGQVQETQECIILAKTTQAQVEAIQAHVVQWHSYECPCILFFPVEAGQPAFLEWVEKQVNSAHFKG